MQRSIVPAIFLLAATAGSAPAAAGEFKPAEVSSKATWFAHVNVASLRDSEVGKQLIGQLDGEAKRQLRHFERYLNFHPINDLESATFYGTSKDPEKAVALIRGKFDSKRLVETVKDADDYKAVDNQHATIHSWKDGSKRIYGAVAAPRLIIIGPELELLQTAIGVTNRDGGALDADDIFGHKMPGHDPIIVGSANLTELGTLDIDSSLARKIKSIYISAGEDDGELFGYAALITSDRRSADLIDKMLHGVLALAEASDEVPRDITEAFRTTVSESGISLSVALPLKQFKALVAKVEKAAKDLK